jgi:hypothetical protein
MSFFQEYYDPFLMTEPRSLLTLHFSKFELTSDLRDLRGCKIFLFFTTTIRGMKGFRTLQNASTFKETVRFDPSPHFLL